MYVYSMCARVCRSFSTYMNAYVCVGAAAGKIFKGDLIDSIDSSLCPSPLDSFRLLSGVNTNTHTRAFQESHTHTHFHTHAHTHARACKHTRAHRVGIHSTLLHTYLPGPRGSEVSLSVRRCPFDSSNAGSLRAHALSLSLCRFLCPSRSLVSSLAPV